MSNYLKNWNFMRMLRLVVGVFFMVQGFVMSDWLFMGAGVLFALIAVMNIACCAAGACKVPSRKRHENQEEVHYEEVR